jgi:hypothetical protein
MASPKKKETGKKKSGRIATPRSKTEKTPKKDAPGGTSRSRKKKVAQDKVAAAKTTKTTRTTRNSVATPVVPSPDKVAVVSGGGGSGGAVSVEPEPFESEGPPQEGGRLTNVTRGQALYLLHAPCSDGVLGPAQYFVVIEWRNLLPEGMPINDDFLGDLDEESEVARNETGRQIGWYRLLDSPWNEDDADDDASPEDTYYMALIWW